MQNVVNKTVFWIKPYNAPWEKKNTNKKNLLLGKLKVDTINQQNSWNLSAVFRDGKYIKESHQISMMIFKTKKNWRYGFGYKYGERLDFEYGLEYSLSE